MHTHLHEYAPSPSEKIYALGQPWHDTAVGRVDATMLLLTYLLEAAGRLRVVASRERVLSTPEVPASLDVVDLFREKKWQSRRNKAESARKSHWSEQA